MSNFSLVPDEYLDTHQPVGQAVRYAHCPFCNEDVGRKGFIVTRTERGFIMFCHRCHAKKFVRGKTPGITRCLRTAKEAMSSPSTWCLRKRRLTRSSGPESRNCDVQFVTLPYDVTRELPTRAQLWLNQYNVTKEEIQKYNFMWSESYERLILPVYRGGSLVYWQGRYFGNNSGSPKYINTRSKRTEVWFDTGGANESTLVLVEDILSAIAVSRVPGYRAVALLGCFLSDEMLTRLQSEGKQVCVWLDLDKQCKSRRYSKRLNAFGIKARSIITTKDPKEYTPTKIEEFLSCTKKEKDYELQS